MNNWNSSTMPRGSGHQRSVSIADYNGMNDLGFSTMGRHQYWDEKRLTNQCHTSYMDLSRTGDKYGDSRRQFSWKSPGHVPQSNQNPQTSIYSNDQRPFESAFKTAINKMKECSLSRLGAVERNTTESLPVANNMPRNIEETYSRNCRTLQPQKNLTETRVPRLCHKVFKCNSTADRGRGGLSSVHTNLKDSTISDQEYYQKDRNNQYSSVSNLYSEMPQYEVEINKYHHMPTKTTSTSGIKFLSGSQVVIPSRNSSQADPEMGALQVVSEAFISPTTVKKAESALPKMSQYSLDSKDDQSVEFLPSVYDIIAKVEAMSNASNNKAMSQSLILTSDKPPAKKPQRSGSQKALDGGLSSNQSEQLVSPPNRMSGLYKKSNPAPVKGKTINNMPFDFQKLHSAFLEQKQEITNLKRELEEKNAFITKLEAEIRSYEPWR